MSQQTKKHLHSLSTTNRQQVERIVMRHASKQRDTGILPHELDPVYRDVIEAVQLRASFPAHHVPIVKTWEEAQQLNAYFEAI